MHVHAIAAPAGFSYNANIYIAIATYTMSVCIIGMARATSSSTNILKNPEYFILSSSTQCCTELNEIPSTAEMVVSTNKMVKKDDKQSAELVIGKEGLVNIPMHFCNARFV